MINPTSYDMLPAQPASQFTEDLWKNKAPLINSGSNLDYLAPSNAVFVQQIQTDVVVLAGKNQYHVKNEAGQLIYACYEASNNFDTSHTRAFTLKVYDQTNQEAFTVKRLPKSACAGCCCFVGCGREYMQEVEVKRPDGTLIGYSRQLNARLPPFEIGIIDANENLLFRIVLPVTYFPKANVMFEIVPEAEQIQVANIVKLFSGDIQERFTKLDNYLINFPENVSPDIKALFIASALLIDFVMFESPPPAMRRAQRRH